MADMPAAENTGNKVIQSIVSTETSEKEKNILDIPPEIDESLLGAAEPPKSILLLILKACFGFLIVFGVVSFIFFTLQLGDTFNFITSRFGFNTASSELVAVNTEINALQTNVNFYNYLQLKAVLDEFSFYGDSYFKNYEIFDSQTSSEAEKKDAEKELKSLIAPLKESFEQAKRLIVYPFTIQILDVDTQTDPATLTQMFVGNLQSTLQFKANELSQNPDPTAFREYKNYLQTMKLAGNDGLKDVLTAFEFKEGDYAGLYNLIKNVNKLIVNDLSIIQEIKSKRIKWSDIMKKIDLSTIAADPEYNDKYYEQTGGIRYTSYDFDSETRKISITGETKLFDTTNFTTIATLIDEFNNSPTFKNAEMRSFSKSGSLLEGYIATLNLALELEETYEDGAIDVSNVPDFLEENTVTRQ